MIGSTSYGYERFTRPLYGYAEADRFAATMGVVAGKRLTYKGLVGSSAEGASR